MNLPSAGSSLHFFAMNGIRLFVSGYQRSRSQLQICRSSEGWRLPEREPPAKDCGVGGGTNQWRFS